MQQTGWFDDFPDIQNDRLRLARKCLNTSARIALIDAPNLAEGPSRNNHLKPGRAATNRQLICAGLRAIPAPLSAVQAQRPAANADCRV